MNDITSQQQPSSDSTSTHLKETSSTESGSTNSKELNLGKPQSLAGQEQKPEPRKNIIYPEDAAEANICDGCE